MCITVDKRRQIRKAIDDQVEQALAELRGNDEAEIDIWGARLEDRLPGRERERLVDAFLSQFGFDESYVGGVKEVVDDSFCILPKSCDTLRKAMAYGELGIHESFKGSDLGRLVHKMFEALKTGRGRLCTNQRVWANWQAVAIRLEQLDNSNALSDVDKQEKRDLLAYVASGFSRTMPRLPTTKRVRTLGSKYPNFSKVVHFLAGQFALARLTGKTLPRIPPILLLGAPGTGKTMFANALAKCMAAEVQTFSMSSQSSGFGLSGLDRGWSSARPGAVFSALLRGGSMAPVFILDEIDKASIDSRTNPLGSLFSLLEPHAAAKFVDEYAGFAVDASSIIWVATANDRAAIPSPLLSRFVVFEIDVPTTEQMTVLANEIYRKAVGKLSGAPKSLPNSCMPQFEGCSPRQVKLLIQEALGRAALRGAAGEALSLSAADFDSGDSPARELLKPSGFGFLANRL